MSLLKIGRTISFYEFIRVRNRHKISHLIKTLVVIGIMVFVSEWLPSTDFFAFAQEKNIPPISDGVPNSMDFKDCVRLALDQSPYFTQSALDIDISRLSESDSKWSFVPTLKFSTDSYLGLSDGDDTKLNISTDKYDPVRPYFSLQVHKLLTEMAVVMHLQIIAEGIRDMAQRILELNFLDQMTACQDKVIECRLEKVKFLQERYKAGVAPQMEVQIAEQELAVSRAETEWLAAKRSTVKDSLYPFFGLDRPQRLDLNLQAAKQQILGDFDLEKFGLAQAKTHSFELKIQDIKKRLQEYRISIAYANFVPSFTFGMKQTSPLEQSQEEDYYVKLGFQINLWNGFKDVNDISRQKMVLRQFKSEMNNKEAEFSTEWEAARRELRKAETAMKLARSNEELASLKKRQSEIFFQSNSQALSKLLDSRMDLLDTRKESLLKIQDYDLSALQIRHLSGDLFNSYVDVDHLEELSNE